MVCLFFFLGGGSVEQVIMFLMEQKYTLCEIGSTLSKNGIWDHRWCRISPINSVRAELIVWKLCHIIFFAQIEKWTIR